jgi:beta-glucosidase
MARACTINEPSMVATLGHLAGQFPPGQRDRDLRHQVNAIFVRAHRQGVEAIRANAPGVPVGITLAMSDYQAVAGGESKRDQIRRGMEDVFFDATAGDDFVGVQTYSRTRVGPDGVLGPEAGVPTLIMGYEFWPEALEATVRYAHQRAGVPIYVTENGIGTTDDAQRVEYVTRALSGVTRCMQDGIDVRGYFYWSLLDNFEWLFGYGPRFGIVGVDRATQMRHVKPSAQWLGQIARDNAFEG